ncbi:hypothetical protein [Novosphingopyxis sp. YJ-S2-01]|uniref:hypothetical protein n=1 Tax=Novosphingopyxis sp. YJ-S2-01 TaxID=2794021 RepID=UPI0018DECC0F|nr:hypothetical protein [Novosphingopyxis sp. YJ-S2-01]MBH9537536.1 hypothetical protein [Novosphingopyxis sp. YJ-S2-01]
MAQSARLALSARRFELRTFTIRVVGINLTGVAMTMAVRLYPDTPGAAIVNLATVTTAAAEGLKLESVTTEKGVPISTITVRINKSTMSDPNGLGRVGEPGVALAYAYGLRLGDTTRLHGAFWALPGTVDSDSAAPTGNYGGNTNAPEPADSVSFTVAANEIVELHIDGIEAVGALAAKATTEADRAETAAINAANDVRDELETFSTIAQDGADRAEFAANEIEKDYDAGADLEKAVDADGNTYRRTDENGRLFLSDLDESVQTEFERRQSVAGYSRPGDDLEQAWDAKRGIYRRIDARGAFYPVGGGSVQHHARMALSNNPARFEAPEKTARDEYSAETRAMVTNIQSECLPYVEPPALHVPNNYDVPDSVLTQIALTDENPVAQLPFPYATGGAVHPYILPMRQPFLGYRYLLTDSHHAAASEGQETPCLFGTNDLVTFDLIPEAPQPLHHGKPGTGSRAYDSHCSDPFLAYDPTDGGMIWCTRETQVFPSTSTPDTYHASKTYDGVHWTPKQVIGPPGGSGLSPSMLYDPVAGHWNLFFNLGAVFKRYTGPSWTGPWTLASETDFLAVHNIDLWHSEVKYMGGRFALCCNRRDQNTDTANVFFGFSADGNSWTMSSELVAEPTQDIYKPTFFPEFDKNGPNGAERVRFTFIWSHWDWVAQQPGPQGMQLYVQRSAWINI